jgi:hypothetical protein
MPTDLHDQLADLGAKWLERQGVAVIATDLTALGCRERADVIGFRSQCSATIESKVSRARWHRGYWPKITTLIRSSSCLVMLLECVDPYLEVSDETLRQAFSDVL